MVSHLSRIVASTANLADLLCSSVRVIQTVLGVQNCSIMLVNREGTALTMGASSSIPEEEWKTISTPLGSGIAGNVAKTGKEVVVARSRRVPAEEIPEGRPARKYRTDSYI